MFASLGTKFGQASSVLNPWNRLTSSQSQAINLTPQSATVQNANTLNNNVTYNLPIAASCPGKIFWFSCVSTLNMRGGGTNHVLSVLTTGSDKIEANGYGLGVNYTFGTQNTSDIFVIQSNGVSWNQLITHSLGVNFGNNSGEPGYMEPFWYVSQTVFTSTTNQFAGQGYAYYFNTTSGNLSSTLAVIASQNYKLVFFMKVSNDANTLTVIPHAGDTINGSSSSIVLSGQYDFVEMQAGPGPTWFITKSSFGNQAINIAGSISGNFYWSMPYQLVTKKFVLVLSAVSDAGRTINFPVGFSQTPSVFVGPGISGSWSASTSGLTVPALTTQTGTVIVEGI